MLPYHPWDLGTRDEGTSDEAAVASLLQQTQVSGINGDTMQGVPADFLKAAQHLGFNIALQTEEDFPETDCSYLSSNVLTWEEFWIW
jgi:hypothetical protein